MKRFYVDDLKLVKEKAEDIYRDVCVGIIEKNNLKALAKKISLQVIDMHIKDEEKKNKYPLYSLLGTLKDIKKIIESMEV